LGQVLIAHEADHGGSIGIAEIQEAFNQVTINGVAWGASTSIGLKHTPFVMEQTTNT
jgi:hypothetical protein